MNPAIDFYRGTNPATEFYHGTNPAIDFYRGIRPAIKIYRGIYPALAIAYRGIAGSRYEHVRGDSLSRFCVEIFGDSASRSFVISNL
jgi:hypothetical protein